MGGLASSEPDPPIVPIQHTYYYIIHGRTDHAYRFIRALSYSKSTLLHNKTVFGPWLVGGYGRQMLKQCRHNTLLDGIPYIQRTETFGVNYAPKKIEIGSHLINSWDLLPPNTSTETEIPPTIPFLAIGCTDSPYDHTSTCIGKAWAPFDDYVRNYHGAGQRSSSLAFPTMRADPIPIGFVTNADPNMDSLPVKWAGVPFGIGETAAVGEDKKAKDGEQQNHQQKTDQQLLGHLYQPPTSAINITGLIHYDGLSDIVDVGHADGIGGAATMMGHLIVLNLMAPSARISIKQFITETHQYLSKGCILPLLEKTVTVIAITEKLDVAVLDRDTRLGLDEIVDELTNAGFTNVEIMTMDCNPTYPLMDEFEDNRISKLGLVKKGRDGKYVGKRRSVGARGRFEYRKNLADLQNQDISMIPNPDGLEDDEIYLNDILEGVQTTRPLWESSCQGEAFTIQCSTGNFFTDQTAERVAQHIWEQVLPQHLSHCRNGLFDRNTTTNSNQPNDGDGTTPTPSLVPPSQFPLAYYTRTNVTSHCSHGGFTHCNLETALEKSWQTPPTLSLQPNSPIPTPTSPQLNLKILSQIMNSIPKRNIKELDQDRTLLHQHHRIGQYLLSHYLKWLASPNSLTNSTLPHHYPPNPHGSGIDYNDLGKYLPQNFKFITNPRPTPLFFENNSLHFSARAPSKRQLYVLDYLPPYIAPVWTPDAHYGVAYRIATPPYQKTIFVGDGNDNDNQQDNNDNTNTYNNTIPWSKLPSTYEFDSFLMYDNRLLISDPTFQLQTSYLPPLPNLNRHNINNILEKRLGNGIKRRLLQSQQYHIQQQRLEFGEEKMSEVMNQVVGSYKPKDVIDHISQTVPRSVPNHLIITKSSPNPCLSQYRGEISGHQEETAPDRCEVVRVGDLDGDTDWDPTRTKYYKVWLQSWQRVENIIKPTPTHYIQSQVLRHMRQAQIIQTVHFRGSFTHQVGMATTTTTTTTTTSQPPQHQPTSPPLTINMTYHTSQTCPFLDPYHPAIGTTAITPNKKCDPTTEKTCIDPEAISTSFPSPLLSGTAFTPLFYLYGIIILPFIYVGGKETKRPPIPALGQYPEWLLQQLIPPPTTKETKNRPKTTLHNVPTLSPHTTTIKTPSDFLPTYQQSGLLWPLAPPLRKEQFDGPVASYVRPNCTPSRPPTLSLPHLDSPIHFVVLLLNDVEWDGDGGAVRGFGTCNGEASSPASPSSSVLPPFDPSVTSAIDYTCEDSLRRTRPEVPNLRKFQEWDKDKDDDVIGTITQQQHDYFAQNVPQAYFNQITTQVFNPLITGGVPIEKTQALFKVDFCTVKEFNTLFDHIERDSVDIRLEMYREKVQGMGLEKGK